MEKKRSSLADGIIGLITIIAIIGIAGYFVSKPKPVTVQGETEASEYRVSGKVPGRIEITTKSAPVSASLMVSTAL